MNCGAVVERYYTRTRGGTINRPKFLVTLITHVRIEIKIEYIMSMSEGISHDVILYYAATLNG